MNKVLEYKIPRVSTFKTDRLRELELNQGLNRARVRKRSGRKVDGAVPALVCRTVRRVNASQPKCLTESMVDAGIQLQGPGILGSSEAVRGCTKLFVGKTKGLENPKIRSCKSCATERSDKVTRGTVFGKRFGSRLEVVELDLF